MKKINYPSAHLFFLITIFLFSCSKKNDTEKSKDNVSIASFFVDTSKTALFKESFTGSNAAYPNVVLIPDINTGAKIDFSVTTNPSSLAAGLMFTIKNDDGTTTSSAVYSVTGNQVSFNTPGIYRISAYMPATATSNMSAASEEVKVQVAPNIPDNKLRDELKKITSLKFTGEILDISSTTGLRTINLFSRGLTTLAGINQFTNVDSLYCGGNDIMSLNISGMTNLIYLECGNSNSTSKLTSVNLKGLSKLRYIYLGGNKLTSIDLQGLVSLSHLDCPSNELTDLNLQGLSNLSALDIFDNNVSALDLTGITKLIRLGCTSNQLTALDVSGNPSLTSLSCTNNKFTSLNLQNLHNLNNVECYSGFLTTLTLSTTAGSYPEMSDLRVPVLLQCTPGIKQIKIDRGTNVSIKTFDADGQFINGNYNPVTDCP